MGCRTRRETNKSPAKEVSDTALSIALVTDSMADLPPALAAACGITVIPLEVRLGAGSYRDGVDLGAAELFHRVAEGGPRPLTSQPPLGEFARVYRGLLRDHDSIISLHISGSFSGTVATAALAGESLPGADITVLDSGSFTLGLGLQVIRAAKAVREGRDKEEVLGLLRRTRGEAVILGVLDSLDWLRHGGRIGKVGQLVGALLRIKPLIRVGDGQAVCLALHRRRDSALASLLARLDSLIGGRRVGLGLMHTMAPEEALKLRRRLEERYDPVDLMVEAGAVVCCHVGPRAIGVAVLPA